MKPKITLAIITAFISTLAFAYVVFDPDNPPTEEDMQRHNAKVRRRLNLLMEQREEQRKVNPLFAPSIASAQSSSTNTVHIPPSFTNTADCVLKMRWYGEIGDAMCDMSRAFGTRISSEGATMQMGGGGIHKCHIGTCAHLFSIRAHKLCLAV